MEMEMEIIVNNLGVIGQIIMIVVLAGGVGMSLFIHHFTPQAYNIWLYSSWVMMLVAVINMQEPQPLFFLFALGMMIHLVVRIKVNVLPIVRYYRQKQSAIIDKQRNPVP
jgi:hypothetical protein